MSARPGAGCTTFVRVCPGAGQEGIGGQRHRRECAHGLLRTRLALRASTARASEPMGGASNENPAGIPPGPGAAVPNSIWPKGASSERHSQSRCAQNFNGSDVSRRALMLPEDLAAAPRFLQQAAPSRMQTCSRTERPLSDGSAKQESPPAPLTPVTSGLRWWIRRTFFRFDKLFSTMPISFVSTCLPSVLLPQLVSAFANALFVCGVFGLR